MKYIQVLGILVITLMFAQCKKESDDTKSSDALFESFEILNNATDKFLEYAEAQNGNHKQAVVLTGQWLEEQPGVALADYHDSISIRITMESGKKTYLSANELDAQGKNLYRGGGGGGAFKQFDLSGTCANKIQNKSVLIFAAAYDAFYSNEPAKLQRVVDLFENADSEFEVTVLKGNQCTPEIVETFGDYGFVSLETHGLEESFMTGIKLTIPSPESIKDAAALTTVIEQNLGANYAQMFNDNKIMFGRRIDVDPLNPAWWGFGSLSVQYNISVSGSYIESLPAMPNTIVFGNMCYSGTSSKSFCGSGTDSYDYPIGAAFQSRNLASYYGYAFDNGSSRPVLEPEAKEMLWELAFGFLDDGDSTGNAHLDALGNKRQLIVASTFSNICGGPFYFQHYGHDDYCYGGCSDTLLDVRDHQVYKTVCIGNQIWMAENLRFSSSDALCYGNNSANCATYGKLYTITDLTHSATSDLNPSQIQGICPNGWHVPSKAEWEELFAFCGGAAQAAIKLRSRTGWPTPNSYTDEFGFNLKPGGFYETSFVGLGSDAKLWSCSWDGSNGTYVAVDANNPDIVFTGYQGAPNQDYLLSCRCVKD